MLVPGLVDFTSWVKMKVPILFSGRNGLKLPFFLVATPARLQSFGRWHHRFCESPPSFLLIIFQFPPMTSHHVSWKGGTWRYVWEVSTGAALLTAPGSELRDELGPGNWLGQNNTSNFSIWCLFTMFNHQKTSLEVDMLNHVETQPNIHYQDSTDWWI